MIALGIGVGVGVGVAVRCGAPSVPTSLPTYLETQHSDGSRPRLADRPITARPRSQRSKWGLGSGRGGMGRVGLRCAGGCDGDAVKCLPACYSHTAYRRYVTCLNTLRACYCFFLLGGGGGEGERRGGKGKRKGSAPCYVSINYIVH